jgi:hypothetical protein
VQGRRLAIDVNILVRAVLGVRHLIERYCEPAAFFVAEASARAAASISIPTAHSINTG